MPFRLSRSKGRTSGRPTSGNGASSFHLWWRLPSLPSPLVSVSVDCEVVVEPKADALYFWALQVGFAGGGAGHTGLQWLPSSARVRRAVNWGGYGPDGRELSGTQSPMADIDGNPNTRGYEWSTGAPHRLTVERGEQGWRASVDGKTIRELFGGGSALVDPVVWSEVFARCDDPSVVVRWSQFTGVTAAGETVVPTGLAVNYQSYADGGCDNTTMVPDDGGGVSQVTNETRSVPQGSVIDLRPSASG